MITYNPSEVQEYKWPGFKGLYLDGLAVDGGMTKAENVRVMPNGDLHRRKSIRVVDAATTGANTAQGFKGMFTLALSSGTKYIYTEYEYTSSESIYTKFAGARLAASGADLSVGGWSVLRSSMVAGPTVKPSFAVMMDRLFVADGSNTNMYLNDIATYYSLGVAAPSAAPGVSDGGAGDILIGTYNVYYTYVRKIGTYMVESDPSPVAEATVTTSPGSISVTHVVSGDSTVTHIRIYRSLYEDISYAYYDQEVTNASATTTITQDDTALQAKTSDVGYEVIPYGGTLKHGVPPKAKYICHAGSRMWYANLPDVTNGKSIVEWSEMDEPEHVYVLNYQTFDLYDGDELMGLAALQNYIVVFKKRKMWLCDMFSTGFEGGVASIARHPISRTIGCVAPSSIQNTGELNSIIFLSSEGVIVYDGSGGFKNISKHRINTVIDSYMAKGGQDTVFSTYDPNRREYHLVLMDRSTNTTGTDSVTNGTFTSSLTGWTVSSPGTGWTYSSGTALHATGNVQTLSQDVSAVVGQTYKVSFDIVTGGSGGTIKVGVGGVESEVIPAIAGTYVRYLKTTTTGNLIFTPSTGFIWAIDNVTCQKMSYGTAIVSERHFVYNMDNDAWTEDVCVDSNGNTLYETAFGLASDENEKTVVCSSTLTSDDGTTVTINQQDYDIVAVAIAGDSATSIANPNGSNVYINQSECSDENGNVYYISEAKVYKCTYSSVTDSYSAGIQIYDGLTDNIGSLLNITYDVTSASLYAMGSNLDPLNFTYLKLSITGTASEQVVSTTNAGGGYGVLYVYSGNVYIVENRYAESAGTTCKIYKKTSSALTLVETLTIDYIVHNSFMHDNWIFLIKEDTINDKYYLSYYDVTADTETIIMELKIDPCALSHGSYNLKFTITAKSEGELYIGGNGVIFRVDSDGTYWSITELVTVTDGLSFGLWDIHYDSKIDGIYYLYGNGNTHYCGAFLLDDSKKYWIEESSEITKGYFRFKNFLSHSVAYRVIVSSGKTGETDTQDIFFVVMGYMKWWLLKRYYEQHTFTNDGIVIQVVSQFNDLGAPHRVKSARRAYLETSSEYGTGGIFSIEPDYTTRGYSHTNVETSEPTDEVIGDNYFASAGKQTWDTDTIFDSSVDNWDRHRLDIHCQGNAFRFSIKGGDLPGANESYYRIRPPIMFVRTRGVK